MDTEFDEWFKLEQEKLEKKFLSEVKKSIETGNDFKKPKEEFEKKFKKLFVNFEQKNYRQMKYKKWKLLLIKPIKKLNKGMDELVKSFKEE